MDEQELTERTEQLVKECKAMGIDLDKTPGFFSAEDPALLHIMEQRAKDENIPGI